MSISSSGCLVRFGACSRLQVKPRQFSGVFPHLGDRDGVPSEEAQSARKRRFGVPTEIRHSMRECTDSCRFPHLVVWCGLVSVLGYRSNLVNSQACFLTLETGTESPAKRRNLHENGGLGYRLKFVTACGNAQIHVDFLIWLFGAVWCLFSATGQTSSIIRRVSSPWKPGRSPQRRGTICTKTTVWGTD